MRVELVLKMVFWENPLILFWLILALELSFVRPIRWQVMQVLETHILFLNQLLQLYLSNLTQQQSSILRVSQKSMTYAKILPIPSQLSYGSKLLK